MNSAQVNNKKVFDVGTSNESESVFKEIRDSDGAVLFRQTQRASSIQKQKDVLQMNCTLYNHANDLFKTIRVADGVRNENI